MSAPAATASTFEAIVPPSRSSTSRPVSVPRKLLREVPTTIGRPSSRSSPSRRSSSRLCSTVLPKPIPGSTQIRSSSIPASIAAAIRAREERPDLVDDVVVARVVLHRPRRAEHVHQHDLAVALGAERRQLGVAAQRGDVVDDRRARRRAPPRRPRPSRCRSRPRSRRRRERLDHRARVRASSSSAPTASAPGPRRLAADVEDVGALRGQLAAVRDRRLGDRGTARRRRTSPA